jgi:hypothetical protein
MGGCELDWSDLWGKIVEFNCENGVNLRLLHKTSGFSTRWVIARMLRWKLYHRVP